MNDARKVTRKLDTEFDFTEKAKALFHKIGDNQKRIVDNFNEIEKLLQENTEALNNSKPFSKYITMSLKK